MRKRLAYNDAPQALRDLIEELQQSGDYLVIENNQHQAVACLAPLPVDEAADRDKAARKLRELLDSFPATSPYSEEETFQHIDEALAAIRQQEKLAAAS
jgi:N-dimethylarginine dimethylaminohydrolase